MENLNEQFRNLARDAEARFAAAKSEGEREALKQELLSRKGKLAELFSRMKEVPEGERSNIGKIANETKERVERLFGNFERPTTVSPDQMKRSVTWQRQQSNMGGTHPISQFLEITQNIFESMGFEVIDSPELEDEEHNFDKLNIPADHPVRDAWDTFFVRKGSSQDAILRTHTSPMQIRAMKNRKPPVRIIVPGRVFRNEASDASHGSVFYQCEGFVIDKSITLTDLMGTLDAVIKKIFGAKTQTRFRPHHYAFVEPGMDVDMKFAPSKDKEPRWLEMLGSGMIHPKVLEHMGVDSTVYSGFAFGLGIDRFTMLHLHIDDIRHFYSGNMTFLEQFR
ncbi:MAG: phenylalanine--tRNA ligase subunit alpha [Patescibacteria group bacterium]|jgi:phenylalanyl-tRNA synthetase alpha chain